MDAFCRQESSNLSEIHSQADINIQILHPIIDLRNYPTLLLFLKQQKTAALNATVLHV